ATITGVGNATKIPSRSTLYCTGCSFTLSVVDGGSSGDQIYIEIDGGSFFSSPGGLKSLDSGGLTVIGE
ncbi:MAG: hypothetical protein AB1499_02645, partial [Nitrospirota bacterium]